MIEGDRVVVKPHSNWNADMARLAISGRVGVIERIFTPLGARTPTFRVVFPKVKPYRKERVEFMQRGDIQAAIRGIDAGGEGE